MRTLKVQVLRPRLIGSVNHQAGDVVELPHDVAKRLIAGKVVEPYVQEQATAPAENVDETPEGKRAKAKR